jgi:hypothetical protein
MWARGVEDGALMYLVKRLCLPKGFDMALELFEIANNEALSDFTNEVKLHRFHITEVATVIVSGSEIIPSTLVDATPPIDEASRRREEEKDEYSRATIRTLCRELATWGLPDTWQHDREDNEEEIEESVHEETALATSLNESDGIGGQMGAVASKS